MSLFGKKNQDADSTETPGGIAPAGSPLFTQERTFGDSGSGKSRTLIIAGILAATVAGGYFVMANMMGNDIPPPAVMADAVMADPAITPLDLSAAPAVDPMAPPSPIDPMAGTSPVDPMAASSPVDPMMAPLDMAASGAVSPDPAAMDMNTPPSFAGIDANEDMPDVPADASIMPVQTGAAVTPDTLAGDNPAAPPEGLMVGTDNAFQAPVTPVTPVTGAEAQPPGDLPVPENAVPADFVTPVAGTNVSPAEKAIADNAAALNQMTPPAQGATSGDPAAQQQGLADIMSQQSQQAVIRPVPPHYVVVRKNSDADDMDTRLKAARQALAQGRSPVALQLFNELYNENPRDQRILMGRAVALQKLNQIDDALLAYEAVLEADPKNLEALSNMLGLLKRQNPQLAADKLQELRDAYPYNADITAQLGIAYGATQQFSEAEKYLDMAEALRPGSAYVLFNKAVLYDRMGRKAEAGSLYRQVLRLAADGKLDQQLPLASIQRRLATLNSAQ
jgi:Flp pilus assembly protein TadD